MAWLANWSYRKSITLSRASGAVTNYQMKLLVGESSGASGEDVDCGGKCVSDFDDIRFTTSDGATLLDYWIESISGTTPNQLATIWIEFDSIGTGATTFYMYYGNAGASAVSNGANTFIYFEDFEWGADEDDIDTSGGSITWTKSVAGSSTAKIDTSQKYAGTRALRLYRDGTNSVYAQFSITPSDDDLSIIFRIRKDDTSSLTFNFGNGTVLIETRVEDDEDIVTYDGSLHDTGANATKDVWEKHEFNNINFTTGHYDYWHKDTKISNDANMYTNTFANGVIRFNNRAGTSNLWIDDVIVRNWRATEPAWGSWGSKEIVPCSSSVAMGLVVSNTRTGTFARSTSGSIGMVVFNAVGRAYTVISFVAMGLLVIPATKSLSYLRTSLNPLGMIASNIRGAMTISRIASAALGMVSTNTRNITASRSASLLKIGMIATNTTGKIFSRVSSVAMGMISTNNRLAVLARTAFKSLGMVSTNTSLLWLGRVKIWISSVRKVITGPVTIDKRIEERSTAQFSVLDLTATDDIDRGEPVEIKWGYETFGGFVDDPSLSQIKGNNSLIHDITCMDYVYLADKRIAAASYENKTCGYIVNELITNYLASEGVTAGTIQDGPTVIESIINYVRVSDALDALAEKAGFIWFIDDDKRLWFIDRETTASPFTLTANDIINDTASVSKRNPLYRNRQYIRGGKGQTSLQTENRIGDGVTTAFTLNYPLAKVPTVTLNSNPQAVGIKALDTGKDWYWSKGDAVLSQDTEGTILESSDTLQVQYYGQYDVIVQSDDTAQQIMTLTTEGGSGYVEDMTEDSNSTSVDSALESAAAKLGKYSREAKRFSFQTLREGLEPGQLLTVNYPLIGFNNTELLVESVSVQITETQYIYSVVAIEGPEMGTWTKFFASLANKRLSIDLISVGSGSTLTILTATTESEGWSESVTETVYVCPVCGDVCGDAVIVC